MFESAVCLLALVACTQAGCRRSNYPVAKRSDIHETNFGKMVADPYRWLEDNPVQDKDVATWIEAQRRATSAYLDKLSTRPAVRKSLTSAYNYERLSAPQRVGERYFYTRKDGTRNQAALYMRDGMNGADRVLVNPSGWSKAGSLAFAE